MTEISNEMMNGNGEPLIVGTNTTLNYDATENSNLTYDTESEPLAVGTNLTIEITYAEVELLKEQLGINLDGSDDYLGSNITVIDGERDWLERIDSSLFYGGETFSPGTEVDNSDSNEPLLVGRNITFVIKEDTDGSSETMSDNESLSERDEGMPFVLGTNLLLELPDEDGQQGNYLGTNLSTIGDNSETQTTAMGGNSLFGGMIPTESANPMSGSMEGDSPFGGMIPTESTNPMSGSMEGDSPFGGMIPTGFGNQPSNDNDDYSWDFGGQLARFSTDDSENIDPNALFAASPWGVLTETEGVDGFEDVFPNAGGAIDSNTFAGGFGGGEI